MYSIYYHELQRFCEEASADEDGSTEAKEQLLKFQIPLGFGSEQLLETDPATRYRE